MNMHFLSDFAARHRAQFQENETHGTLHTQLRTNMSVDMLPIENKTGQPITALRAHP